MKIINKSKLYEIAKIINLFQRSSSSEFILKDRSLYNISKRKALNIKFIIIFIIFFSNVKIMIKSNYELINNSTRLLKEVIYLDLYK